LTTSSIEARHEDQESRPEPTDDVDVVVTVSVDGVSADVVPLLHFEGVEVEAGAFREPTSDE